VPEAAEELRSDGVPDREEEQQEEDGLHAGRDDDPDLSHGDSGDEDAGHRADREAADPERADPVTERQRQEDRELRMLTQRLDEPGHSFASTQSASSV